jgi:hypothetical protein
MHNINQIESRLGLFTVMMAVRFQSESCPTWEPFNLISKDKKEGQMLSSFYAHQLSIIMQSMWACTHTHTHRVSLNHTKNAECVKELYLLHVSDRCSLLFLILLVSAATLKNSEMENSMLRG